MKFQYWNIQHCRYYFLEVKTSRIIDSVFLYLVISRGNTKKVIHNNKKLRADFLRVLQNFFNFLTCILSLRRSISAFSGGEKSDRECKRVCRASRRCIILYGPVGADFNIKSLLVSRTGTWRMPAEIRRWIRARTTGCYWVTRTRRTQCSASVDDTTHATRGTWRSR